MQVPSVSLLRSPPLLVSYQKEQIYCSRARIHFNWNLAFSVYCPEASPPTNGFGLPFQSNQESTYFYGCHPRFHLPANYPNTSICVNGKWDPEIPRACLALRAPPITAASSNFEACNPLLGITFTTNNCHLNGLARDCRLPLPTGSQVTSTCRQAYDSRQPIVHTCQSNGEWSPPPTRCNELCGQASSPTYMPWHVLFLSGHGRYYYGTGTIVSDRIVVAFGRKTNESERSFTIHAGLTDYTNFAGSQERDVLQRIVLDQPGDARDGTFALYVTGKAFEFDLGRVVPICIDYTVLKENNPASALIGKTGIVTTHRKNTFKFDTYVYTIIHYAECVSKFASTNRYLQQQLELGNFCAHQSADVINDDENCVFIRDSGLAIPEIQNGKNIFYLRGITNEGHFYDHKCNWDDYQTFINIIYFLGDIKKYTDEYKVI